MRLAAAALIVLVALPGVAGDRFVLDLSAVLPPVGTLDLEHAETVPEALQVIREHDEELRLALWSSPLGRVTYDVASQQAALGREGLVGGEHMLGAGSTSLSAFGAAPDGQPLVFPSRKHPWRELSTGEKVEAVAYGGLLAALLYQMAQWAD